MVGTATSGDYSGPASGTLTIPVDQTTGTITIATVEDDVLDRGETLIVRLSDETTVLGSGLVVVGTREAATTILDSTLVRVTVSDATPDEGEMAAFAVELSDPVEAPVILEYSTADGNRLVPSAPAATAASGDYTAVTAGRLTIAGSQTSATISIATGDDQDGEPDETFTLNLLLAPGSPAGVELVTTTATATIRDDDLKLGDVPSETVREGEVATITWPVEVTPQNDSTLNYRTVDGTATAGDDFTAARSGTVQVRAGATSVTVTVATLSDDDVEGNETFTVILTGAAEERRTTVTIEDADELVASVTRVAEAVAEGETARFTVTLGGGTSTADVVVSYSVGGTAKAPDDYTAPSGSLTIGTGQASGTIAIETKTDDEIEPDETLVVTLDNAETKGAARVGSPSSATTTIQDVVYHSINRVNQALLPSVARASAASALEAVSWRMAEAAQGRSASGYGGPRRADRALPGAAGERAGVAGRQLRPRAGAGRLLLPGAAQLA